MKEERYGNYDFNYIGLFGVKMSEYADNNEENNDNTDSEINRIKYNISKYMAPTVMAFSLFLVIGSLSIVTREGVYAGRESQNWMGPVNSFLTMSMGGFFLGSLAGVTIPSDKTLASMLIGGLAGFIAGAAVSFIPSVQHAFNNSPMLYYIPTTVGAITSGVAVLRILF